MTDEPLPEDLPSDEGWRDEPGEATTTPPSGSRRRKMLLILAIVAVVLVALTGAFRAGLIGGEPQASPSPSVSASPSASPSESDTASPSASASRPSIGSGIGATWTTVTTVAGAAAGDVALGGPGFVAVGAEGQIGCELCPDLSTYIGRIWSSTDGREWDDVAVTGLEGSSLSLVAAGPNVLVAFGPRATETGFEHLLLVSSDGATWSPIADHLFQAPGTEVADITGDSSVLVATGALGEPGVNAQATIWISTDGAAWETIYQSPNFGRIYQVVSDGDSWVAIGELFVAANDPNRPLIPQPAAWTSEDGKSWSQHQLPLPDGARAAAANALALTDAGLVAVGYAEYGPSDEPAALLGFAGWQSADGSAWSAAPVTEDMLEDIGGGFLVYTGPDRVFAIGSGCLCGTGLPGRWWTTPDGMDWTQHAETPPILHTVVASPTGLIAVGQEDGAGAFFVSE